MPLAFLTFLAILSLNYADNPCRFEHSKGVIDLTSIASTTGPRFKDVSPGPSSNYKYSYNPCKSFDEGSMCINVAACQVSQDGLYQFALGTQESTQWDARSGLGDKPSVSYSTNGKQVQVTLICDRDASTPELEALGENPTNFYKFTLIHKCACWDGCQGIPPQQNCTIDGFNYTSDKQVIQSFPFTVVINPLPSQPLIPTFSYANVDLNGRVINVTLVGISSIPPALFCLQGLQGLSVFDSPSASIPPEISRLSSSLKSLTIANMPNSSNLPPELFTLKQLSLLSIINCGLETLPEDIGNLISLVQLNLDQNLLLNIPWGLGRLPSLTSLSLQNNRRLSSIDTLIGSKSLTTVRASNCSINQLPRNISNLSIIELDGNQLRSLDGLETISAHHSTSLSFNDNQITTISSASLKQIVTLDDFSLSGNLLTTLPDSLYLIKGLKTLYITDNKFDVKETEWIQGLFRLTNTTVVI